MHGTPGFVKRPICAAVQAAIYAMALSSSINVQAAPAGGQVVGGSGSINQSGLNTTINQTSQNMAINWQSYNVNQNERVQYIQPNSSSISLNRIISNNGSTIAGRIDANGQVILVNPNGIYFTSTAVVNVGGIISSSLDIKPDDFMNGHYVFNEVLGKDGKVVNTGTINAALGGNVALLGKQVENDGLISANLGTVSLAAGKQAVLTFDNGGVLGVRISKAVLQDELGVDPAVLNKGNIEAAGGRVLMTASTSQDVFSQAVNTGDIQQATSVVVNADGSFTLGNGADVVNTGSVDTSTTDASQNPGQITLLGNNVTSSGILKADAASGNAGEIELHSTDTSLLTENSLTSARSGSNGVGGFIKVLGDKVGLFDQSSVDVSGANGGGQALIGGDLHGGNPFIQNASYTIVNPGVSIFANATNTGNGGKVIVWSDIDTFFLGNIFAKGGVSSGDGGFVETSGKQNLKFSGLVDTSAPNGRNGALLLDPAIINITNTNNDANTISNTVSFSDTPTNTFNIDRDAVANALSNGDVLLEARNAINVTVDIGINNNGTRAIPNNTNKLSMVSGGTLDVQSGARIDIGQGDLVLVSGALCPSGVTGCGAATLPNDLTIDSSLRTSGNITLESADNININADINDAGSLTARAGDSISLTNATITMSSNGGKVDLYAADLNIQQPPSSTIPFQTVGPSITPTGLISMNGYITTNGGDFNATAGAGSTAPGIGHFINNFSNTNIFTDTGSITINTHGSGGALFGALYGNNLTVNTNGGGIVQSSGGILSFNGGADLDAGAGTISLNSARNFFGGTLNLTANGGIGLYNATNTIIGGLSSGGATTITSENNLSITGAVNISGASTMTTFNFGYTGNDSAFNLDSAASLTSANTAADAITVNGNTGNDTFSLGTMFTGTLNGGGGYDTLQGPDAQAGFFNDWSITGAGTTIGATGALNQTDGTTALPGQVAFNDITVFEGGAGDDAFTVNADVTNNGLIFAGGGSGTDSLSLSSALTTAPTVSLLDTMPSTPLSSANTPSGTNTFWLYQIGQVDNASTTGGVFTGPDAYATWNIQLGNVSWSGGSVDFTGFDTLNGGNSGNNFTINSNQSWVINAGSAGDEFHLTSDYTGNIAGGNGTDFFYIDATGIAVSNLIGDGNGNDTVFGPDNTTNTWTISSAGGGDMYNTDSAKLVHFTNMNAVQGGNATDNFSILTGGSINSIIGDGGDNSLTGLDADSTWTINGGNSGRVIANGAASPYVTDFQQIQNLTGGSGVDTFNHDSGSISGLIDGGAGAVNVFNDNGTAGIRVQLFYTRPALPLTDTTNDVHLFQVTTLNNNNGANDTLVAPDMVNSWGITSQNTGSLVSTDAGNTASVTFNFSNFQNLEGGSLDDTFTLTSNSTAELVTGMISGGGQSTQDKLYLNMTGGAADAQVKIGPSPNNGYINVSGIEYLNGNQNNNAGSNTVLVAADTPNNWDITTANGGVINPGTAAEINFENFSKVVGGNQDDVFKIETGVSGNLNFTIDGGSQQNADYIDYSAQSVVDITYDPAGVSTKSITNIEGIKGNGTNSSLHGPDSGSATWNLTDVNSGDVRSGSGVTLSFQGFNYLIGGASNNTFNVSGAGSLVDTSTNVAGMIQGGSGSNTLSIDLPTVGTSVGQLDYVSLTGSDTIEINNTNPLLYDVAYTPGVNVTDSNVFINNLPNTNNGTFEQLAFAYTNNNTINTGLTLNYKNISATSGTVTLNQAVDTLTVNGVGLRGGNISLATGGFRIGNNNSLVNYTNVTNLTAQAGGGYGIRLTDFNIGGVLTLADGPVTQQSGTITAGTLMLNNTGNIGNSSVALMTNISNLGIQQAGDVYIDNTTNNGDLTLTGLNATGLLSIVTGGGILNSADLNLAGNLNLTANGNINLTVGTNALSGQLNLVGNQISLTNTGATDLGAINATGLSISSTGNITESGVITAGAASFSSSNGDISLTNQNNDFDTIGITDNGQVSIVDIDDIGLTNLTANSISITAGDYIYSVASGGVNLTASDVSLVAQNGIGGGTGVSYNNTSDQWTVDDSTNPVTIAANNLSVKNYNTTGANNVVNISSQRDVTIHDLRNNGDIILSSSGTVNLDGSDPGAITANYDPNNSKNYYSGLDTAGSIAILGNNTNSLYTNSNTAGTYDIVGKNLFVNNFVNFGTKDLPIRILIANQATLVATTGFYHAPDGYPARPVQTTGDFTSIDGVNVLNGQQLIDIESLGDVDPAVFTKVRNYNQEDVAIMMPADQRLDDESECTDTNKKKCHKKNENL